MKILAISGSLRAGSHNTDLLQAAAAVAPDGIDVTLYDGLKEIPAYDADDDFPGAQPAPVRRFKDALAEADAVVIATPEYNSSIPGVLKNALDWASRPLAETRKVLGALGARTLEDTVAVPKADQRLANGVDATLLDELRTVVDALATAVEARDQTRAAA